jgi:hypothetical protein
MAKIGLTIILFMCIFLIQVSIDLINRYDIPLSEVFKVQVILPSIFIAIGGVWLNSYLLKKGKIADHN